MIVSRPRGRTILLGILSILALPGIAGSQQTTGSQPTISDRMGVRHWRGEGVSPVYEGFDVNADGSYNLWFGYMNLNFEEELDIPVGPENTFEPGGDRGQPTHFAPRRHKDIFKVVVPKDFGKQKLMWKLIVRGKTETIDATLNPVWQIDRRRTTRGGSDDAIDSNTPPVAGVQPPEQTIAAGAKATLVVTATDDGLPRRIRTSLPAVSVPPQLYAVPAPPAARAGGPGPAGQAAGGRGRESGPAPAAGTLSYEWFKYRGPGQVNFDPERGILADGKQTSSVSFAEPGDYVLQVIIDDGSGESAGNFGYHCCWTNVEVKVHVTKAAAGQR